MKAVARVFYVLSLISMLISFSACDFSGKRKYTRVEFDYFDTASTVIGYERSEAEFEATCGIVFSRLEEYHKLYDIYNTYDGLINLCNINSLEGGEHKEYTVDPRITELLLFCRDMYELTGGEVNVAMGSVLSLWHECRTEGMRDPAAARVPTAEELASAAEHTDIASLQIDKESDTVYISDPRVTLDVGAVAKGYATEMIARELEEMGISGYTLNIGGNVRTVGTKPDGEPWAVGAENPDTDAENPYIKIVSLSGEAFVTSGSYQRYYFVNGKKYHHIIDKDTLCPAVGYQSVSVIADSSALADALSTALFASDIEWGMELLGQLDGVYAMWYTDSGEIYTSEGFERYTRLG
ncbi:MAG: FAD:protein FMN transferase [Clostridia bacterium]|nr:FAD:protein FMN transferase [Clostridia bacterium]